MGGGDLVSDTNGLAFNLFLQNLKKSWHPLTRHNLEKVWKAEQNAEKEKAKLEQLRKGKQQERELEDLQSLNDQGFEGK